MTHASDDDLVLHRYGEDPSPAAHLAACHECAARYRALASDLELLAAEPPARDEHYGLEVWQRIRSRLPEPEPWWRSVGHWRRWAPAAVAAVVLIAAGIAIGRMLPPAGDARLDAARTSAEDEQARRRVLLLSVADHLDRSERILTDIVNATSEADLSAEQQSAVDLVATSRLYRQDAIETDETSVAVVLDELERTLLEIVHHPAQATAADLEAIRRRIDSAALLFKVRVMSTELRARDLAGLPPGSPEPPDTQDTIG